MDEPNRSEASYDFQDFIHEIMSKKGPYSEHELFKGDQSEAEQFIYEGCSPLLSEFRKAYPMTPNFEIGTIHFNK